MLPYRINDDVELHPFDYRYTKALFALVDDGRDYLRQWQNWPDRIRTVTDMHNLIYYSQRKHKRKSGLDAVIMYKGEPAGKVGLVYIDWRKRYTEIGYWLGEAYQGHGLMTRSCRVMVNYALGKLDLNRVQIRCAAGNIRSSAIPQRLGFSYEGVHPQKVWIHGAVHDELVFALSHDQWRENMLYHITTKQDWEYAKTKGEYCAESLHTQGFIHLSQVDQVVKVANAVYAGQKGLVLLCIDPELLTAELRYEAPDPTIPADHYDGELFPHLYGPMTTKAVISAIDFPPNNDGMFDLPDGV